MKLKILKNRYGLRLYCTKCYKQFNHDNTVCNHDRYHHYKSIVTDGMRRRVKLHQTKDFDLALQYAIQFKKDVKNGVFKDKEKLDQVDVNEISILEAANMFIKFKKGDDVPEHLKQDLTEDYFKNLKATIQQLIDILRKNRVKVETLKIAELNDIHVGFWFKYIRDKYAETTLPSKLKSVNCFINHVINHLGVSMKNPFQKIAVETPVYNTRAITKEEFEGVIDAINTKSPYQQLGGLRKEIKNHYRPYLKDGLKLALYTGLRREELVTLSWNDIGYSEKNRCLMLVVDNLKVERFTGKKYKKKFIPIGPDLELLLYELGLEDLKGSDLFILEPNRKIKYTTMMAALSKGFSHYYKQAFPEFKPAKFKILRKTYLSYLNKSAGDDMIELSSHGGMKVLNTHYLDAEIVAKGLSVKIFE